MATPLIVSKSDFVGRIDLPANLDIVKKLNTNILHAEDFDLRGLMGDRYYFYFISFFNPDGTIKTDAPTEIKNLYKGSVYSVETISWSNPGIIPVLVYFSGARLIKNIGTDITPHGFNKKLNEFSESVSTARLTQQANEYENQAIAYWNQIKIFLGHNKKDYPNYFLNHCGCEVTGNNEFRPKRFAVGGW